MAKLLSDNELIVLGLIAEMPRHGYDIHRVVDERGMREWTSLGLSSLYYLLEKLHAKQLIVPLSSEKSDRAKQVFTITKLGKKICRQATCEALRTIKPHNTSLLIGLANSPIISSSELTDCLETRNTQIGNRIASVTATHDQQQLLPDFVDAIFDYSISLLEAERTWLQKTVATIGNRMEKIDIKKELKDLYNPSSKDFSIINVPKMSFLMIDGQGNPNTDKSYAAAVEALYAVAYTIKFASKKNLGKDYGVLPLEGLWTADKLDAFTTRAKDTWKWTMMIMQPEWITDEMVAAAIQSVKSKKNPKELELLRFEAYDEGEAVQIMHIGSYDDEAPTLHELHATFMPEHQLTWNGPHHEIYLGDPRKTAPERLKTILRQPVKKI